MKEKEICRPTSYRYSPNPISFCFRDASSARPDGSMEVCKLYWFKHNCKNGQYSSAKVHRSIKVVQKEQNTIPSSVDDYEITVEELPGLTPEIIEGV